MSTENDLRAAVEALADEWEREDADEWHRLHAPDVKRAIEAAKYAVADDLRALLAAHAAPSDAPQGEGRHDVYCEGGRCRCFTDVDSDAVGKPLAARADHGASATGAGE